MAVNQPRHRAGLARLLAVHLLLSLGPLANQYAFTSVAMLPLVWGLASIVFGQISLLALWIGMSRGRPLMRIGLGCVGVFYLNVWLALGQKMPGEVSITSRYLMPSIMLIVLLALLSGGVWLASRFLGVIRWAEDHTGPPALTRSQFSLLTLLVVSTLAALWMGIIKAARDAQDGVAEQVAMFVLMFFVYVLIVAASAWATLGASHVLRRVLLVFGLAVILGYSVPLGAGFDFQGGQWWLMHGMTVISVVPTLIVVLTLLEIRRLGGRLVHAVDSDIGAEQATHSPLQSQPEAVDTPSSPP